MFVIYISGKCLPDLCKAPGFNSQLCKTKPNQMKREVILSSMSYARLISLSTVFSRCIYDFVNDRMWCSETKQQANFWQMHHRPPWASSLGPPIFLPKKSESSYIRMLETPAYERCQFGSSRSAQRLINQMLHVVKLLICNISNFDNVSIVLHC